MGELSPTHWLIVIVVAVVLFGARRLPDAARSLGRSARILKSEISGIHDDAKLADPAPADAEAPAQPAGPPALESAPAGADANAPSTTPVSAEQPAAAASVKSEADVQGGGVRS